MPSRYWIGDSTWAMKFWRDLPVNTCMFLAETRPDQFKKAFTAEEFQSKKRRLFGPSSDGFRNPVAVPCGFIEVNVSSSNSVSLVERLLKFFGVELSNVGYEIRGSASGGNP